MASERGGACAMGDGGFGASMGYRAFCFFKACSGTAELWPRVLPVAELTSLRSCPFPLGAPS